MMGRVPKNFGAGLIGLLIAIIFGVVTVLVIFKPVPDANKDFLMILLNTLSATLGLMGGYLFSSSEKKEKEDGKEGS
jgi:hypothetical protein